MSAIPVHLTIIVDPCGRVLVHEVEKLAPGESYGVVEKDAKPFEPPDNWYRNPACVAYNVTVEVPVPRLARPQITYCKRKEECGDVPF